MKRRVLTIHGINSDGRWQDEIKALLGPYYACINIRYQHYRYLGALGLFLEPWVSLVLVGLFVLLEFNEVDLQFSFWAPIALVASVVAARIRRWLAFRCVVAQCGSSASAGWHPHIIAHSLGTYFFAEALRRRAEVRADRIVLTGGVINEDWDWAGLMVRKPSAFAAIRNEVGRRDRIARMASILAHLINGFGRSGYLGFRESDIVHTIPDPNTDCKRCCKGGVITPVHNVVSEYSGHSDSFIGPGYAAFYWLPFFWDIQPEEYRQFREMCEVGVQLHQNRDPRGAEVEEIFGGSRFSWAPQYTLREYIRRLTEEQLLEGGYALDLVDEVANLAMLNVWYVITDAMEEVQRKPPGWERSARRLYPCMAISVAVDRALPKQ